MVEAFPMPNPSEGSAPDDSAAAEPVNVTPGSGGSFCRSSEAAYATQPRTAAVGKAWRQAAWYPASKTHASRSAISPPVKAIPSKSLPNGNVCARQAAR